MNYIIAGLPFPLVWAGRALDRQWSADDLQTLTLAVPSTFTATVDNDWSDSSQNF